MIYTRDHIQGMREKMEAKKKARRNKYNNAPQVPPAMLEPYAKGRTFRSKEEHKHALWLLSELQAGRIKNFEFEKQYELAGMSPMLGSRIVGHHKPDFTVWMPDGTVQIHEIKYPATESKVWAIKRKLFEILYPEYRYREYICGTEKKPWFINLEDE